MSDTKVGNAPAVCTLEQAETVAVDGLLGRVQDLANRKLRFVTASCLDCGDHFELYYHFDADLRPVGLRVPVGKDEEVPSITGIYLAAFLVENEIKELFGVNVTGIVIDYKGHLLLTEDSEPTPMARSSNGAGAI